MKVAACPIAIAYADHEANLAEAARALDALEADTRLALLPELFTTGFVRKPQLLEAIAEGDDGPAVTLARNVAAERGMAVAGSFLARGREPGRYYNRAFVALPDGSVSYYDKYHLFTHSGEDRTFTPGTTPGPIVTLDGCRIRIIVCYDLRFPAFCRNTAMAYDLLLVPANWPASRRLAFETLARARAIENQAVVIACNRLGADPFGEYPPDMSAIYDCCGADLSRRSTTLATVYADIDLDAQCTFRNEFPVHLDADPFTLHPRPNA